MHIIDLTKEFIAKHMDRAFARENRTHISSLDKESWILGWNAAIKFSKKVNKAYGTCEQCGKLIVSDKDLRTDADGAMFCKKCFEKVFGGEDDKKLLCWNDMSEEEKSDFFFDLSHQK